MQVKSTTTYKGQSKRQKQIFGCFLIVIIVAVIAFLILYLPARREAKRNLFFALESNDHQAVAGILDQYPVLVSERYYVFFTPPDASNSTPLHHAIHYGDLDMVKLVLSKGTDVNKSAYLERPLHDALDKAKYDVAWCLIESGADLSAKSGKWNETVPFCILAWETGPGDTQREQAQYELLKYVLEHGASLDPPDGSVNGIKTLLGLAVYNKNTLATKYLLDEQVYGVDEIVNPEYTRQTALIVGVKRQSYDCCQLLLDYGADKTVADIYGKTAMDYAEELKDENLIAMLSE